MPGHSADSLDWLMNNLVDRISGAECAVVLSADGLPVAGSDGLGRDQVEHLAAIASALHSLGRGIGTHFGKGLLQQTMIELEHGYLVVTEAGHGSCLALLTGGDADLGLVGYEMNVIVGQVRDQLSAAPRTRTIAGHYGQ
ncbi:putative regulator of Ras-like GTPase activity (Roadblock/LC7/MglB family) [Nocardia mexicana]|uniref:Putative regulator of Ras-like GTPase activity (Roadblock/LC7/MglB family) n=2 Tax=Nocardia mexicana TaxID=279262 RepID=A0A370HG50_9NOCA|nr:putative regulator of Ras-like GTPase activity (Roadblock/LC7/MglB family) [Nocardia mexicana]